MKLTKDTISFYYKKHTISLYWPSVNINKRNYTLQAKTIIGYKPQKDWAWHKALVFIILGIGVGWAYNHCDNPNYEKINYYEI